MGSSLICFDKKGFYECDGFNVFGFLEDCPFGDGSNKI